MEERIEIHGITWSNISQPDNKELAAFVRNSNLLSVDAEFIANNHQRPEVTVRDNYVLILLHIPVFDKKLRVTSGAPIYFVVRENAIYTLQYDPIVTVHKIMKEFEKKPDKEVDFMADNALNLALHIIGLLNTSSFRKITRLAKHIEIAEDAVFHGNERKMVEEVAILSRDVLDFRRIIRPQITLFAQLPPDEFPPNIQTQWLRIGGQLNQIWEVLQALHDSSKELRDTNDSLLQHKENELLRLLSYYSIITIPIWIFVSPFDPTAEGATTQDQIIFWGTLSLVTAILLFVFIRARMRRVL